MTDLLSIAGYQETLIVRRQTPGSYVNGNFVEGDSTETSFVGVTQPLTPRDLALLPEGQMENEGIKIYTETQLFTGNEKTKQKADIIVWRGNTYEVLRVEHRYQIPNLVHYKAQATLTDGVK